VVPESIEVVPDSLPDSVEVVPDYVEVLPDSVEVLPHSAKVLPDSVKVLPESIEVLCPRCCTFHAGGVFGEACFQARREARRCARCRLVHSDYDLTTWIVDGIEKFDCELYIPDMENHQMDGDAILIPEHVEKKLDEIRKMKKADEGVWLEQNANQKNLDARSQQKKKAPCNQKQCHAKNLPSPCKMKHAAKRLWAQGVELRSLASPLDALMS
jgi:hypothetical protein